MTKFRRTKRFRRDPVMYLLVGRACDGVYFLKVGYSTQGSLKDHRYEAEETMRLEGDETCARFDFDHAYRLQASRRSYKTRLQLERHVEKPLIKWALEKAIELYPDSTRGKGRSCYPIAYSAGNSETILMGTDPEPVYQLARACWARLKDVAVGTWLPAPDPGARPDWI